MARSAKVSEIVSWLPLPYVVTWEIPLKVTAEEVRNPVPLIINAWGAAPTASEAGRSDVIAGTGLFGEAVTVNGSVFEVVSVTFEFVTPTEYEPDVPSRLAGKRAVKEVGSEYVVDKGVPLKVT